MTQFWLGVVSREHVLRGVRLGIAQVNHGSRTALIRMRPGDGFAYYSARERMRDGAPVRAFTAIGTIDERDAYQADEGSFRPWRRSVSYRTGVHQTPIDDLRGQLELTRDASWGIVLRRGLVELSRHDFEVIAAAMSATGTELDG